MCFNCRHATVVIFCALSPFFLLGQIQKQWTWQEYSLPKQDVQGNFICMGSNGILMAGGFEVSAKRYSDEIFILNPETKRIQKRAEKLPHAIAYGVAVTYGEWMIIAGGKDSNRYSSSVYALRYRGNTLEKKILPSLPYPLAHMSGCVVDDYLFLAGGDTSSSGLPTGLFLALNLRSPENSWVQLPPWPGPPRKLATAATLNGSFYLFGGQYNEASIDLNVPTVVYSDAYQFIPHFKDDKINNGRWVRLASSPIALKAPVNPAPTIGLDHILFIETVKGRDQLVGYNASSNQWVNLGNLPLNSELTGGVALKKGKQWLIIGNATDKSTCRLFILSKRLYFGWLNWLTLIAYLILIVWIGFRQHGQHSTKHFFTADGRIPWWAAGLSIYGSQISAITFMAVPAVVFATDWSLLIGSLLVFAVVPIVIKYFVPFFRRLNLTTAYEYLEKRFDRRTQLLGSLAFIVFQFGRMGIVLYLPAAAISAVTGIDIYLLISIMGIICILYTVVGGIEAVVWTDVAQVIILLGGAILCFFVAVSRIDGGFSTIYSEGMKAHKFALYNAGFQADHLVLWVCIVGFFFLNIIPYTSDQTVIQRYLTVKDEKKAAKSLWINAWISLPGTLAFFGLGTVLYIFYKANPGVIASDKVGEILPYFVVQQLPAGLSGLVIAGIFAASQSSLSASMNSVSASFFADIFRRSRKARTDREDLNTVRKITIVTGVFGTASAIIIAALDVAFIFDLFQEFLGILGGSFTGVFILGIFTKRSNARGVFWGILVSVIAVWSIKTQTQISVYLYGAISVVSCVLVGYAVSCLFPSLKNIEGLYYGSIQSLKKNNGPS